MYQHFFSYHCARCSEITKHTVSYADHGNSLGILSCEAGEMGCGHQSEVNLNEIGDEIEAWQERQDENPRER